ncbi:hypothetical protein HDF24_05890 [Mucilaginibacter sp. X4EP1]|nr:hypothetical protein [Mucilaginibacter sp. X4EP1]MCS3814372.1 flagellar basal body-associated protein FliL [Mucilaginibacter sp. X4EP1]
MDLLKKTTFNNSVYGKVLWISIIAISVCFIGYMVGQFAWYVSR